MGVLGTLDGAIFLAFHSFPSYPLIFLFCRGLGLGTLPLAVLDWGLACPNFARVPAWALGPLRCFIPFVPRSLCGSGITGGGLATSPWCLVGLVSLWLAWSVCWAFALFLFLFLSRCSTSVILCFFSSPLSFHFFRLLPSFHLLSVERRFTCGSLLSSRRKSPFPTWRWGWSPASWS